MIKRLSKCKKCDEAIEQTSYLDKYKVERWSYPICEACSFQRKGSPEYIKLKSYLSQSPQIITKRKQEFKLQCLDYLGGRFCSRCGYNKCVAALDFHHVHPNKKEKKIMDFGSFDELCKKELNKCIILCSNCHREHHHDTSYSNEDTIPFAYNY